jgi:hypothetical protein
MEHHKGQISIYMKERNKPGKLVYVEKNTGKIVDFILSWDDVSEEYDKAIEMFKSNGECVPGWQCGVAKDGHAYCEDLECPHNKYGKMPRRRKK